MNEEKIKEIFASKIHDVWAYWQKYLHSVCTIELKDGFFEETGRLIIESDKVKQWQRQIETPYSELSELEKKSDRQIFEKFYSEALQEYGQWVRQQTLEEAMKSKKEIHHAFNERLLDDDVNDHISDDQIGYVLRLLDETIAKL